jgi:MerR family transcriptional regulator, light-induced transcriptional regulator
MSELALHAAAEALRARQDELAEAIVALHYSRQPELAVRYGARGREKCLQDAHYHLSYLLQAIIGESTALFSDYVAWAHVVLAGRGIPTDDLRTNLQCLRDVLSQQLPDKLSAVITPYIEGGLQKLVEATELPPSFLPAENPHSAIVKAYLNSLLRYDRTAALQLIQSAVDQGTSIQEIYLQIFQRAQHELGRLWQINQITVAQEHFCTAATQHIMSQLYPYIFTTERRGRKLVAACVAGDQHELGIRMVADFFELEGWDTYYFGANTPTAALVQVVNHHHPDILALSATMTYHVSAVTEVITAVRASAWGAHVKILVGGYPFILAPTLWQQVGADGFASDARETIHVAERLLQHGTSNGP